jgi:hypothetical protein
MFVAYWMRRRTVLLVLVVAMAIGGDASAQPSGWTGPPRKGRKYKVRIDSAPQMAAIYLEDESFGIVGYTPWNGELTKGSWNVILKRDGYELGRRQVNVARSRNVQETFVPLVKRNDPAVVEVRADADPNAFGARVSVDGQPQGEIPATIKLDGGRHLVEVRKEGFRDFSQWIQVRESERQTVNPVMRAEERKEQGAILVDADVAGADVFLDGNKIDDTTPTIINDVLAGPHVIEVRKAPAVPWRQTVQVEKGKTSKVSAELKATIGGGGGNVRVLSNVKHARVWVDGTEVGEVPLDVKELKPGLHLIEVRADGFEPREERVTVSAGSAEILKLTLQKVEPRETAPAAPVGVTATAPKPVDTAPSAEDREHTQRNLTSYAARVAPRGNSTIDFAGGYPYFGTLKFTVGAGKLGGALGFDAGVMFRTFLSRSEIGLTARMNLVDEYPFSFGMFTHAGGGSNFIDDSQRSSYFFDGGFAASLTGLGALTITGRAYANLYTDRHCPALDAAGGAYKDADADGIELCDQYLMGSIDPALKARIDNDLLDGDGSIFERDNGVRVLTSLIVEVAIQQRWNMYLAAEWAPFQEERAAFTDAFSSPLMDEDPISYGQVGFTYKF